MKRAVKMMASGLLVFISLLGVLVSLIAIADPVGTKMADDNDPFGPPPSRISLLVMMLLLLAIGAVGVYIGLQVSPLLKSQRKPME
jgi:hypothetical protein